MKSENEDNWRRKWIYALEYGHISETRGSSMVKISFKFDQPSTKPTTNLSFLSSLYFPWIQVATVLKLKVKFLGTTKTPYLRRGHRTKHNGRQWQPKMICFCRAELAPNAHRLLICARKLADCYKVTLDVLNSQEQSEISELTFI